MVFFKDTIQNILPTTILRHTMAGTYFQTGWDKIKKISLSNSWKKKENEA